jgi:hypothetical protein
MFYETFFCIFHSRFRFEQIKHIDYPVQSISNHFHFRLRQAISSHVEMTCPVALSAFSAVSFE